MKRALVAVTALAIAVSGCTSSGTPTAPSTSPAPIESADAGGEVAAADGLRPPQDAGVVPGSSAAGVPYPDTWPASELTGAGLVSSRTPTLRPEGFGDDEQVTYQVFDVSAGQSPEDGAPAAEGAARGPWQVTPALEDGRQYAWRAAGENGEWKGPWPLEVDTVRPGLAPRDDLGGVSTHLITGVPGVTWMSRSFATVTSSAVATLEYQPGRSADPGLPPGWRMTAPLTSRWTTLEASGDSPPATVYISDARDRSMTFRRNESGVYLQSWSSGRPVPASQQASLSFHEGVFTLTELDGTVTSFQDGRPVALSAGGVTQATSTWRNGALASVTDPSGRSLAFSYGPDCEALSGGFVAAPEGMLCRISWWDGSTTEFGYVPAGDKGTQIGLIVDAVTPDFPGTSLGIGWDAAGRVSTLRSAIVGAAAAADSSLRGATDLLTQIAYDDQGRVAAVAAPAPAPGQPRAAHVYSYPTIDNEAVRDRSEVVAVVRAGTVTGPLSSASDVAVTASTIADSADYRMTVRAADWTPVRRQDRDGAQITLTWDEQSRTLSQMRDYEGRTTSFSYDGQGRRTESIGPATSSDAAYKSKARFDELPNREPMRGMRATYWATPDFSGAVTSEDWIKPGNDTAVSHTWDQAPLPAAEWSARLIGTWEVPASGAWTIQPVASDDVRIAVFVDGNLCDASDEGRCVLELKEGRRQLRVDLSVRKQGGASFYVKAGREADGAESIDTVYPAFNAQTSTESNDVVAGADTPIVRTEYQEPWTGNPTSQTAPGGLTTTATYEPANAAADQWGRKLTGTTPGGRTTSTTYWPVKGSPEQSPCSSIPAALQAGQVRTITRTDGVTVTTWYDAAGRPSAVLTGTSDTGDLACMTHAPDGTVIASTTSSGGKKVETSTVTIAAGGDPRVTVTSTEVSGTLVDGAQTTRVETDLLGRVVSYTDISGVVTTYAYDVEGRPTSRTITAPDGSMLATVVTEYDGATGRVSRVTVDGQEAAAVAYDDAGRTRRVQYGNGVDQEWSYAANGTIASSSVRTKDDRTIEDAVTANDAGRVIGRSTTVTGEGATKRTWEYGYDTALRLTEATLQVKGETAGVGADRVRLSYGFGRQAKDCPDGYADPGSDLNRTSGSRDGTAYETCYDSAGRPVSTTDPLLAIDGKATLSWDALGRLTSIAGNSPRMEITWRWGGLPQRIVDGPVTTDLDHAQGRLVAQRSADDSLAVEWRMAYSSPSATAPSVILGADATEVRVLLPGGALWRKSADVTIDHPGIRGEFLVRTGAKGAVVPGAGGGVLAEALGPYGEPLAGGTAPGGPEYGYAFDRLEPTMPGPSGIVLKTARPYMPALGAFLAFDTQPGSSSTGYGYAEADPLNRSDPDGAYSWWDFGRDVLAITSIAVSLAVPGAQWYTVLAISVLASSAQLGITAMERFANGQEMTNADYVFEGISVGVDMLLLGIGEGASAVSRKLSKPAKAVGQTLDDINVKPGFKPSNLDGVEEAGISWKRGLATAAGMVFGMRALTGGFSSGQSPGTEQGQQTPDPQQCPFEGGCGNIPDRGDVPAPRM